MRGRSYAVLLRCFAASVAASAATLSVREARGDTHVAARWSRDRQPPADPGARDELIERAFEAGCPVVQPVVEGERNRHSAVAAAFWSDERALGALHAAFEPPSVLAEADLAWAADSYARLAALCMGAEPSLATVLGSTPTDAVTGCLSHEGAIEVLEHELERSRRRAHRLSCCMLEIEGLEEATAGGGQIEGDRVRAVVGWALRQASRRYDAVGRVGGDEFLVVMPETGGGGLRSAGERFRRSMRSAVADEASVEIDVSLGARAAAADDQAADGLAKLTRQLASPLGGDAGRFSPRLGVGRRSGD